ncbi:phosphotransferase family protein [Streptomyces klenkii]|uniref:phosphotransferase family protein n=1 Tax=Streptomyces klenkii TaxID=1420899 RepID=UPI00343FA044
MTATRDLPDARAADLPARTTCGRTLILQRRLHGGRSHVLHLAHDAGTGEQLVVKTGGDPAKLRHEARALTALTDRPGLPCSRLISVTCLRTDDAPRAQTALLIAYAPGHHPRAAGDFHALGRTLATWHTAPTTRRWENLYQPPARLLRLDRSFAAHHAPDLTGLLDTLLPPTRHVWTRTCLVHGDPSPPNTLIHDGVAVLIDCENAALAHPGLDLGRALFHAHWHSPTSADALLAGYTDLQPLPDQLAAWTAAAGIHIAAWRHSHRRRQGVLPWSPALEQARHWAGVSMI